MAELMGARLERAGVTRRFGEVTALAGVDLDLSSGSSTTLLESSGCGKSTLLSITAGLRLEAEVLSGVLPARPTRLAELEEVDAVRGPRACCSTTSVPLRPPARRKRRPSTASSSTTSSGRPVSTCGTPSEKARPGMGSESRASTRSPVSVRTRANVPAREDFPAPPLPTNATRMSRLLTGPAVGQGVRIVLDGLES
ncbi:MAG: hypothetical protein WKF73_19700 [Nocardioidaceae bacterium]